MFDLIADPKLILLAFPGLLIGLNTMFKKMGMSDRWCPLVNLVGGLGAIPFLLNYGCQWPSAIVLAIMIGLSAGGAYDFQKFTVRNEK